MGGRQQHKQHSSALKEGDLLQQRVTPIEDTDFNNQQDQGQQGKGLELLVKLTVKGSRSFFLGEFIEFMVELLLGGTVVLNMDIGTTTGLGNFLTHLFIEHRHDSITGIVFHEVIGAGDGNGGALGRADTQNIHTHILILGGLGGFEGASLMIFTIGNHDDSLANAFILGKAMGGHVNGSGNIGALGRYHRGVDAGEEHLGGDIVTGNGQLHKGVACKDNQTDLVIREMVDEVLDHHLTAV